MSVSLINGHIDRGSMTPQEALAWVEDYEKAIKEEQAIVNNGDEFHVEALKVCEVVKQALEKQIPKKPILAEEQHIRYSMNYICPLCGKHFSGTGIASYCYHCGQALIWEDHPTEKGGIEE